MSYRFILGFIVPRAQRNLGNFCPAHMGPMSQDFHAAFGVGEDDRHITQVDEGGVALVGIQGLNQKVEEKSATIQRQGVEIAELKARLENWNDS